MVIPENWNCMRAYPFLGVANVDSAVVISTLLTGTLYLLTAVSELHTCSLVSEVTCFLILVPQSTPQFLCFWEASERKLRHWINGNNWIIYHFSANLNIFLRWWSVYYQSIGGILSCHYYALLIIFAWKRSVINF